MLGTLIMPVGAMPPIPPYTLPPHAPPCAGWPLKPNIRLKRPELFSVHAEEQEETTSKMWDMFYVPLSVQYIGSWMDPECKLVVNGVPQRRQTIRDCAWKRRKVSLMSQ